MVDTVACGETAISAKCRSGYTGNTCLTKSNTYVNLCLVLVNLLYMHARVNIYIYIYIYTCIYIYNIYIYIFIYIYPTKHLTVG